jgi:hypothetical protein
MSLVRCPCLQCDTDPALMVTDVPVTVTLIRSSLVCEQNLSMGVSGGLWTSDGKRLFCSQQIMIK